MVKKGDKTQTPRSETLVDKVEKAKDYLTGLVYGPPKPAKPAKPAAKAEVQKPSAPPKATSEAVPKPARTHKTAQSAERTTTTNQRPKTSDNSNNPPQRRPKTGDASNPPRGEVKTSRQKTGDASNPPRADVKTSRQKTGDASNPPRAEVKTPRQKTGDASNPPRAEVKTPRQKADATTNAKTEQNQNQKLDNKSDKKTKGNADSKSEGFSFNNLTKMVVDTGKKIFNVEPEKTEPVKNKVENADKLTPKERKAQQVETWVDPKTGARHDYDKEGRLKELRTKDNQRSKYEYDEKTQQLKNFSRVKTDEWRLLGGKSTGYAEAVDGKVVLEVNQKTGEVKTSSHDVIEQKNPKTQKAEKVEVKSELFFHTDGSKSALTRELNGRRISKDLLTADDKQTGKIFYQYNDQTPGKAPNPEAPVLAIQYGTDNKINHKYEFTNSNAVEKQKAAIREDIKHKVDGPIEREKHETYDLRSGKEVIMSRVEKTVDNKKGQTKVHEQQYDKGKLATDQTVTFDERAKAVDMQIKDVRANVDVSIQFDNNGKPKDVKGAADKQIWLAIAEGQATRIQQQHGVQSIDAAEMLVYNGPSAPREGNKPTGVLAWKESGSNEYSELTAVDGIIKDSKGNKIGTVNDKGDVTINGHKSFNILTDKQYAGVFHGFGTDEHPLNLCSTQAIGDAKRQEGMNGYVEFDGAKVLMVGGYMFDQHGKFVAHMDANGRLEFAKGTEPRQEAGTEIKSFLHGDFVFKGNENGNERRFFVQNSSQLANGKIYLKNLDEKTGLPKLDASGKPLPPNDCEVRLGMVIDRNSQKQLSNFIPPRVNSDKTFSGGSLVSMDDQPKFTPLSEATGTSFDVDILVNGQKSKLIGVAAGPQQFQPDGTPVPGVGGVINLQREIELEDKHLATVTADRDDAVNTERNQKLGAAIATVDPTRLRSDAMVDSYNETMGTKQQTDALRTRQELALKHHDETVAQIKELQKTGAIDANLLYKLQIGNAKVRESQLDIVDQQRFNNPEHRLETITCDPKDLNGYIKRPDLKNPGVVKGYDVRSSLVYKEGTEQCVGEIDPKTGTMKLYSATGRVETTRMNDPRLAGTIFHMEYPGQKGDRKTTDWLADGTGKLQSFDEMRKQAADQKRYVQALVGIEPNEAGKATLERTQLNEARLNKDLDNMLKNGVSAVSVGKDGSFDLGHSFKKILEGPKANVRAENLTLAEKQPPRKTELHQLRTSEDCSKTTGAMRIGGEFFYCKNGRMFKADVKDGVVTPKGDCIGTLEPGYVVTLGNRQIALQNESQFLFRFTVDGDTTEHRVFGTGPSRVDANGAFTGGGLVEADSLIKEGLNSRRLADQSMREYFQEKPSGNYIADGLGWSVNKLMLDREGQMRHVGETIDNSNAGLRNQIEEMFTHGFSQDASSNNRIDHHVNTVNRCMRDLNLSVGDMDALSMEGRTMQKQSSEGAAMGLMSFVPGGVGLLASRMGVTSVVGRGAMAFVAGGTISVATRQSEKSGVATPFATGGLEAMTMFAGAEGFKNLAALKAVSKARTLKAGEQLAPEVAEIILKPETIKLMQSPTAHRLVEFMGNPKGTAIVEGMYRTANAGLQTTGLTLSSSIREGNYDQMKPGMLVENSIYMLAGDLVALSTHIPSPGIRLPGSAGRAIDAGIKNVTSDAINNFSNSVLTARVQAYDAELENIARERNIPKELISAAHFELYKNQTRMNAYILNTAAEGVATGLFTSPLNQAMEHATTRAERNALERSMPRDYQTHPDGTPLHPVADMSIQGGGAIPDHLINLMIPLTESKTGFSRNLPDGSTEQWLHSGGQIQTRGDKISYVQDANGRETHIKYDEAGEVTRLDVIKGGHKELWIKNGDQWIVDSNGQKYQSNEKISIAPDGSVIHESADGKHAFNTDGTMYLSDGKGQEKLISPLPDEPLQRDYFGKMVEWHVEDPALQRALNASSNHLMERVIVNEKVDLPVLNKDGKTEYKTIGNVDRVEYAKCLKEVSELLQDHPDAKFDKATRQRLAEECLWLAANPTYLSQGAHPTCTVAAVEVRQYTQHPSDVIRAVKELALTGEYKCPDGKVLKPFHANGEWIFQPDDCSKSHYKDSSIGREDGKRLMASQLWQGLAVAAHYSNIDTFNGETVGLGNIGFHNDFISDMRTNPPRALAERWGTHMMGEELESSIRQLTGRTEDLVLGNKRYGDIDPKHYFEEMEDLHGRLWEMYERGDFPVTYAVNTANPPFNIPGGGEHLVSIIGIKTNLDPRDPRPMSEIFPARGVIDPRTGKQKLPDPKYVELIMDNQWKKGADNELRSVPLTDAYLASFSKSEADAMRSDITGGGKTRIPVESDGLGFNPNDRYTPSSELDEKFRLASELVKEETRENDRKREGSLEGNRDSIENTREDDKVTDQSKEGKEPPQRNKDSQPARAEEKSAADQLRERFANTDFLKLSIEERTKLLSEMKNLLDEEAKTSEQRRSQSERPFSVEAVGDGSPADRGQNRRIKSDAIHLNAESGATKPHETSTPQAQREQVHRFNVNADGTTSQSDGIIHRANAGNFGDHLYRTADAQLSHMENALRKHEDMCLEDAKVPGTLSEFGFEFELAKAIADAGKTKPPSDVVCAFIDLNNFKNVNVLHSMDMGDEALKVFGKEAENVLRKYGIENPKEALGHFGGDEFGILLKNQPEARKILDEIMSIRIGCKPVSNDPHNQKDCEFVILGPQEKFEHTGYKIETDEKTKEQKIVEQSSPVISATLGAVRWEKGMSAEDVLQTADKVMFRKKPIVKAQLSAGGDAILDPFDLTVDVVRDQEESSQLRRFLRLSSKQEEFRLQGMTKEEIQAHREKTFEERAQLYYDLLNKHRHTGILDKPMSKDKLAKYIAAATNPDGSGEPFTIIKLSIDNFKQVNDRMQSHAKGNRVLREVGDFLRTLDVDFLGSLGGTSPFLVIKDPTRVDEIMKKCDEYFLKVSPDKADPERIGNFKDVSGDEISVGFSAGKLEWKPGMDTEMLLNEVEVQTKECEKQHIEDGRHTRRDQVSELPEGQSDRRVPIIQEKSVVEQLREKFLNKDLLKLTDQERARMLSEMKSLLEEPSGKNDTNSKRAKSEKPLSLESDGSETDKNKTNRFDISEDSSNKRSDNIIHRATDGNFSDHLYRKPDNEVATNKNDLEPHERPDTFTDMLYVTPEQDRKLLGRNDFDDIQDAISVMNSKRWSRTIPEGENVGVLSLQIQARELEIQGNRVKPVLQSVMTDISKMNDVEHTRKVLANYPEELKVYEDYVKVLNQYQENIREMARRTEFKVQDLQVLLNDFARVFDRPAITVQKSGHAESTFNGDVLKLSDKDLNSAALPRLIKRLMENQHNAGHKISEAGHSENEISLADKLGDRLRKKGNVPKAGSGDWTYSNFERVPISDNYANMKTHLREFSIDDDGFVHIVEHPFVTEKTMDEFVEAVTPMLNWKHFNPEKNPTTQEAELEHRRKIAEDGLNKFLESQNLPPITLVSGAEVDEFLKSKGGRGGYKNSTGKIMVRSEDLFNATDPEFIGLLYHEIMHVEQDVAMIRASALDSSTKSGADNQESTLIDNTKKQYLKVSGFFDPRRDSADAGNDETKVVAKWISDVVKHQHSKDWIDQRKHMTTPESKLDDADYIRADWLRKSHLTKDASGVQRNPKESTEQVKEREQYLADMLDSKSFTRPFDPMIGSKRLSEVEFLKGLSVPKKPDVEKLSETDASEALKNFEKLKADRSAARIKVYGYDPLESTFQNRDQTFTELLQSNSEFARLVREGSRKDWLRIYDDHVKTLIEKAKECDSQIKALDPNSSDYKERLEKLQSERPDVKDRPRTLKVLTRWELKGFLHGMEQRDYKPLLDNSWNYPLADHITLVQEDANNHKERIRYRTTMRKGEEQEAYYVTDRMSARAAAKIEELNKRPNEAPPAP